MQNTNLCIVVFGWAGTGSARPKAFQNCRLALWPWKWHLHEGFVVKNTLALSITLPLVIDCEVLLDMAQRYVLPTANKSNISQNQAERVPRPAVRIADLQQDMDIEVMSVCLLLSIIKRRFYDFMTRHSCRTMRTQAR